MYRGENIRLLLVVLFQENFNVHVRESHKVVHRLHAINDRKGTGVSDSFSPTVHVLEYTGVNMAVKLLLQYSRTDAWEFLRFYLVKKLP